MSEQQTTSGIEKEVRVLEPDDFASLLKKEFKPKSDRAKDEVENAVRTLAEYVLKDTKLVSSNAVNTIEAIKAAIDQKLTEQINQILHHSDFQQLEGAWRGLYYLINNTETDEMLKIRALNISKNELAKTLKNFKGVRWDQSPIFKKIYGEGLDLLGGEPFGCLVGDYHFDHSPQDVEILGEMSKIAAAGHSPFISGAAPSVMQMGDWKELMDPADLAKRFEGADYAEWRALRESEDSRYIGLAMPRFLARRPYGAKAEPVEKFDFEEDTEGADSSKYCWANSAYAMATNITRSFKLYGWCSRIRGVEAGGAVEELPVHSFPTDDGGVDMKCPTEIAIGQRREAELANLGFMPLLHKQNSNFAAFIGAQSLQKPFEYDDPDATANANLSARLPYLFACCRFAHYLKVIVYNKVGTFKEADEMQRWLNKWIMQYVVGNPGSAGEREKSRKPLAAAEIKVKEVEGNPGYYTSTFHLRPHYQLEGLTVSPAAGFQVAVGKNMRVNKNLKHAGGKKMAFDCLLKINGVDGESKIDGHEDEIDILSWSWGMAQSGTTHTGGGGGAGKINIQDLSLTKYVDKSTPELMRACCNGKHFDEAVLTVRKAGEEAIEYMKVTMNQVLVTSVSTGGSGGEDRITENVTLNFAKMETGYTPQKEDGTGDAEITMNWNIEKNIEE